MTHSHVRRTIWTALVALAFVAPAAARAQDIADKFQFHGSLVWGYGLSDGLGVFGVNKQGTTDYKTIALQFRYQLDEKDQFVTQLMNLSLGSSPMAATQPTIVPIWAYYQRTLGDFKLKVGRDPLPRGIFNETRRIGTLLPFYRVGADVYQETLEYIDGVTLSRNLDLGKGWGLDATAFAGGTDLTALLPSSAGVGVIKLRLENLYGGQVWLNTPLKGLRLGAFETAYSNGGQPGNTGLYSLDGNFEHFFVRGEYTTFDSKGPKSHYDAWYGMGGIKLGDKVTLAEQYMVTNRYISFGASPLPPVNLQLSTDVAEGITVAPSANVSFKFEVHHHVGYAFDSNVPTFIPPTRPPLVMGIAPASKANYLIASVAISF